MTAAGHPPGGAANERASEAMAGVILALGAAHASGGGLWGGRLVTTRP